VADYDLDSDADLYVSNMFGPNHFYRNMDDGKFADVTDKALQRTSWGGMGARFFDGNGDDLPDLYVVDMHSDMVSIPKNPLEVQEHVKFDTLLGTTLVNGELVAANRKVVESPEQTQAKRVLFGNTYFQNLGDGTFEERSAEANLENYWPWGIAAGDCSSNVPRTSSCRAGWATPSTSGPTSSSGTTARDASPNARSRSASTFRRRGR